MARGEVPGERRADRATARTGRQSVTAWRTWSSIACSPSLIRLAWKPMNPPSLAASAAAWALAVSQAPYAWASSGRGLGRDERLGRAELVEDLAA